MAAQKEMILGIWTNIAKMIIAKTDLTLEEQEEYLADTIAFDAILGGLVKTSEEWSDYVLMYNPMETNKVSSMLNTVDFEYILNDLFNFIPDTVILFEPRYIENFSNVFNEETFKLYSTKSPAIVHIATHGFYLPFQDHSNLDSIINNNSLYEDDMLQRCGLVFAGANNVALGNRNIPDDIEDGILSASEIANLDLFNTEIVVMSACQTGLGTVGEDGVFGLQRAFKKAGAQSILMTLWSVDDNVTQKLMVEFYKGLIRGLSKYDALRNAQLQIRQMMFTNQQGEVCSGNNPYYWAPFVILD
jgi:hypothetical protein